METPLVKNCPLRSAELVVSLKKVPKNATTKSSLLSLMFPKKFVT